MKIANYFKASWEELTTKVSWPTYQQLINTAGVVLTASLIFALIIFFMDSVSDFVVQQIYKISV